MRGTHWTFFRREAARHPQGQARLSERQRRKPATAARRFGPGRGGARGGRSFLRESRGSLAVEGAIAVSILVAAFAGLMAIVQESYSSDRLGRAARAAARAVALDASADPCAAIRREFGLPESFDCNARWRICVDPPLLHPSDLSSVLAGGPAASGESGDMVMVRIAWSDGTGAAGGSVCDQVGSSPRVAMGVARREPDAG